MVTDTGASKRTATKTTPGAVWFVSGADGHGMVVKTVNKRFCEGVKTWAKS